MISLLNSKLQLARKVSFNSTHRVKIGAVISKGKNIVGVGFNKADKTHPLISKNSHRKLHAEVSAIIGIDRRLLTGGTIYVYRENLNGEIAICKPCPACQSILSELGIKHCYYTDPEEENNIGYICLT